MPSFGIHIDVMDKVVTVYISQPDAVAKVIIESAETSGSTMF